MKLRAAAGVGLCLVLIAFFGGAAGARTITGTERPDRLTGTRSADALYGLGGADRLVGGSGNDFLEGGAGRDTLSGQGGADRIVAQGDGYRDSVSCGAGTDVVNAEAGDAVARDCEVVSRQLGRDPYRNPDSQHETHVEPDSFAFGSTIVAVFQVGRFFDGGASNIGYATSRDGGRRWRSGLLPGLTRFSTPTGSEARASDPVVAYDAAHRTWLAATLGVTPGASSELSINRSTDGLRWGAPVTAARSTREGLAYDKEWIACDNWPTSRFYGRCYLSYTDVRNRRIVTQRSSDGGLTWSSPVVSPSRRVGSQQFLGGAFPVTQPDGKVVVVFVEGERMAASTSSDGGVSFAAAEAVSSLEAHDVRGMRAPPLPSVDVDPAGRIYAVWHDCRFRPGCSANDVVLTTSADGRSWSPPRRVPLGRGASGADRFVPAIAVDPAATGRPARLAVLYHSLRSAACEPAACRVDIGLVSSPNAGQTWSAPRRLNAQSAPESWIALTNAGRMVGDYVSVSFARGRAVPVFSLPSRPRGREFRQAIFATIPR